MQEPGTREILRHAVKASEQTTEAAHRSMQIVNETKEVQAATLESLQAQGDQMKRIQGTIQDVEEGVDEAEVVLDSMRCCGCFGGKSKAKAKMKKISRMGATPNGHAAKRPAEAGRKDDVKEVHLYGPRPGTFGAEENGAHADEYGAIQDNRREQDKCFDYISDALDKIKEGALQMGEEVEYQNKTMDGLKSGTEGAQRRVADAQGHKVIRKHAKGLGRK